MDGATRKMANQPSRTYSYVIKKNWERIESLAHTEAIHLVL